MNWGCCKYKVLHLMVIIKYTTRNFQGLEIDAQRSGASSSGSSFPFLHSHPCLLHIYHKMVKVIIMYSLRIELGCCSH